MSAMVEATKARSRAWPIAIVLGLIALGFAASFLARSTPLERSAIGFDGLGLWLAANDVAVRAFPSTPGDRFRVLGVFDGDLADAGYTDGNEGRFGSLAPRGMSRGHLEERIAEAETLVVLPKWRGGVVDRGRIHPDLLVPELYTQFLDGEPGVMRPDVAPFSWLPVLSSVGDAEIGHAALYAPQVLGAAISEGCEPVWRLADYGILLAHCENYQDLDPFYILSDPDLLNNHGLALGENAELALVLLRDLASGRSVYVDQAGTAGTDERVPEGADLRERSGLDLERLFRYPFSLVWLSLALASALALWRGNVRFGPALAGTQGPQLRGKQDAIRASGGLMHRAGGEGDLALAHGQARMAFLANTLLGPAPRAEGDAAPEAPLMRFLAARSPALGTRLGESWSRLAAEGLAPAARIEALPPFEAVFQEILDEFGRAARPPRRDRD